MIVCLSANPAVDRRFRVGAFAVGGVHRAVSVEAAAGGKAAHVALAARALGEVVLWVGLAGGETGAECERGLAASGVDVLAVRTASATRCNVEIVDERGVATEVLEPGGAVTPGEVDEFVRTAAGLFDAFDGDAVVVMSGSLPPGAPADLYATLAREAARRGCKALVDAGGEPLRASLAAAPLLVKPNLAEAAAAGFGAPGGSPAAAVRGLVAGGALGAAVTDGPAGIVWLPRAGARPLAAAGPVVEGRSAVGCGDATMAGFAVAFSRGLADEEAVRLAVACGAANCLADSPGRIRPEDVERLAREVRLEERAA